ASTRHPCTRWGRCSRAQELLRYHELRRAHRLRRDVGGRLRRSDAHALPAGLVAVQTEKRPPEGGLLVTERSSLLLRRNLRVDAVDVDALLPSDVTRSDVPEQTEQDGAADPVDDVLLRLQPEERVVEERPV